MLEDCAAGRQQGVDINFELVVPKLFCSLRAWEDEFIAVNIPHKPAPLTLMIKPKWKRTIVVVIEILRTALTEFSVSASMMLLSRVLGVQGQNSRLQNMYMHLIDSDRSIGDAYLHFFFLALSEVLQNISLPNLKTIVLSCVGRSPANHNMQVPNWNGNSPFDHLSRSLNLLSLQESMTEITLYLYPWGLSSAPFWPFSDSSTSNAHLSEPKLS
ncbi:hypothetical protein EMCG_02341 [[Emmonsia] crescens]|uniref:Uncharacterized protein n=1 Tax=[Emmonsia] crescens TaxID=73230 RepID=A0A0G2HZR5_9EURO|nr:hypothetical protein EMCG_02341 [Emmonsia crescens UAMH 3008]